MSPVLASAPTLCGAVRSIHSRKDRCDLSDEEDDLLQNLGDEEESLVREGLPSCLAPFVILLWGIVSLINQHKKGWRLWKSTRLSLSWALKS